MLVIRFLRTGKKNQPSFKIVVTEKTRASTSGRFVEEVGNYNPRTKDKVLKQERIKYWISVGAKPLARVHNLLISEKIIEGKKIDVHKKSKKEKEPAPAEAPATEGSLPSENAPAEETAKEPAPAEVPAEKKLEEKPAEKPAENPKTE